MSTARQQVENCVLMLHRSILALGREVRELHQEDGGEGEGFDTQGGIKGPIAGKGDSQHYIQSLEDTAAQLYELVFSSAVEKVPLTQAPPDTRVVVNTLLSQWTSLSEADIYMMTPKPPDNTVGASVPSPMPIPPDVGLVDARGRKYRIPWEVAKTWVVSTLNTAKLYPRADRLASAAKGMEGVIIQIFCRVPGFWTPVLNKRYDIVGADDTVMLPQVYDRLIKPGAFLFMRMWPPEATPSAPPSRPRGPVPGTMVVTPPNGGPSSPPSVRRRTRRAVNSSRPVYVGS